MVSRTQCGTLYAQGDCRRFGQFRTGHWRRGVWREQPVCKEATRAQSVLAVAHNTRSSGQVRRLRTKREIQEDRGLECNWQAQLTEQWRTGTAAVHGASSASLHTADKLSLFLPFSFAHFSLFLVLFSWRRRRTTPRLVLAFASAV